MTPTRYGIDRDALGVMLDGEPRYRVEQVWHGLYGRLQAPEEMTNLPLALRRRLDAELPAALEPVTESVSDAGDTVKFLWTVGGGPGVETVLMLYPGRATVCVSSQAGCAMGCGFCATGQAGFTRHLTTGEIVEQVVRAARRAGDGGRRVSNVVFMGMGEPLANEAPVWGAVRRFHDDLGLSARHLTISTVGIVPGIRRLTQRDLPVTLAVSLHAANDELRNELVPINRRYPLGMLLDACRDFIVVNRRRISFEWALIDGVNDRPSDAVELAALCRRLQPAAHVNLIPLNPTPGWPTPGTPPTGVRAFRDLLVNLGTNVTVRRNRGTDIDAACGQLAARADTAHPVTIGAPPATR
ncbi:MAG: 23S rRNA (adenine(2503)-C(2))-methyltransferase RlmN [Actinomycetota bacterium]|nr:23S rRNA (adenine(2503)-C(2))-methyltransferase RlmN [Acidimicrobiia bacterium]MDQ3470598.1 23S rRNA (adenine(2503)-C(2))-methyltransferase RlmN [Actinomycetota bacterium]